MIAMTTWTRYNVSVQKFGMDLAHVPSPDVGGSLTDTLLLRDFLELEGGSDHALSSIMSLGRDPVAHRIEAHPSRRRDI